MKVLFVVPYPSGKAASQRFRFEHYLDYLQQSGIVFKIAPFLSNSGWDNLYKPGNFLKKVFATVGGFWRRLLLLFSVNSYNVIFIHREATPLGPAWFEWTVTHIFKKKVIYDFDDAIWIAATSKNNKSIKWLKNAGKVKSICKWSLTVVTGNNYLAAYALQFNKQVRVIPTVVDTDFVHNILQDQDVSEPSVGWTGTFSTLKYLDILIPVINELQTECSFEFIVIADKDPQMLLKKYRFIRWEKATEIKDLLNFHIGLMPLYDDELSKGKCGFKAIQYMALGIPAIVSPVGVNTEIVDNGVNGFVCKSANDWKESLGTLLKDSLLRMKMGAAARQKIQHTYSVNATKEQFKQLFF